VAQTEKRKGLLAWVERAGNRLPDPVLIFVWLIAILAAGSAVAAAFGYSALHPTQHGEDGARAVIRAASILSPENIRRLWVEMPQTFTHFHPLGCVLVVMLGAGVAERSGLFAAAMRAGVRGAPKFLLTPAVAFVGMMGNLAADAAYMVLIPLAAVLYAAAGRHPVAGITAAFAAVSGGFSANLLPGQLDALTAITRSRTLSPPGWNSKYTEVESPHRRRTGISTSFSRTDVLSEYDLHAQRRPPRREELPPRAQGGRGHLRQRRTRDNPTLSSRRKLAPSLNTKMVQRIRDRALAHHARASSSSG
jgi:hypothetical protein